MRLLYALLLLLLALPLAAQKGQVVTQAGAIKIETIADSLEHPWGIALLPDGRALVSERPGRLRILNLQDSTLSDPIEGVPEVYAEGQGGLLDVKLDPDFADNQYIYLSYADPGPDSTASSAFGRGRWTGEAIEDFEPLFVQEDKLKGEKHFGSRIVFDSSGHIFFAMGERFQFEPAQDLTNHLGTVVRLNCNGSVPDDNPFVGSDTARAEIYSYGNRNIQAAAIDPATGQLWVTEMGPMGGDELNAIQAGKNYGWPLVSWGDDYDGSDRPEPPTRPEFTDAAMHWTPTISPSGMIFYTGAMFPEWQGSALIGGLTASGLVRVVIRGTEQAEEVERIPLVVRVRDVVQAPDGSLYVLTDEDNGKVLHLRKLAAPKSR